LKNVLFPFAISTRVYPKVSGLATWSENCKWYISLPLDAVVSLLYESVSLVSFATITLCVASQQAIPIFCYQLSPETFQYTLIYTLLDHTFRHCTGCHHDKELKQIHELADE